MRLFFPQKQTQDVFLKAEATTIGAASGNDVVLKGESIQTVHATITSDTRGLLLWIRSSGACTHVNGRPIREKAILRIGDTINIGDIPVLLCPDSDESIRQYQPPAAATEGLANSQSNEIPAPVAASKVLLRGMSGRHFGKAIPIVGRLVIGRSSDCDLILDGPEIACQHAWIEVIENNIYLHDRDSVNGALVNGIQVRNAVLFSGDQIVFDRNRFIVEAPGMPNRLYAVRAEAANPVATTVPTLPSIQTALTSPYSFSHAPHTPDSPWLPLLIGIGICVILSLLLLGFF